MFGLSAIGTGLDQIDQGKIASGRAGVRAGYEFLRGLADEAPKQANEGVG
jgi:hypothetical protein